MTSPSVAVVMPSFDRPAQLQRCLEALEAVSGPAFEVIVVDDGSPEPLEPVCRAFGEKVRCLRQVNKGPAAARNAGAAATTADFIAFTDDDCRPRPGWLEALVAAQAGHESRLVGGRVENLLDDNVYSAASQSLCDYLYDYYGAADGTSPFFTSNNIGCSRRVFLELGGFDVGFPLAAAEDRDFGLRWRAGGGDLVYAPDAVVDHAHRLDMRRFWRQHRNYGRGARHLHRVMDERGDRRPKIETLKFYLGLIAHPVRANGVAGAGQALLLTLSQVAMTQGYVSEVRSERRS